MKIYVKDFAAALLNNAEEHRSERQFGDVIFNVDLRNDDHGIGHFSGKIIDHLKGSIEKFGDEIFKVGGGQTHFYLGLSETMDILYSVEVRENRLPRSNHHVCSLLRNNRHR